MAVLAMNRNVCHAFCDQSSKQLEQAKCRVVAQERIKERKMIDRCTHIKLPHRKTDSMKMVFFPFTLPIIAVLIFGEAAAAAHDPIPVFKPGCRVTKCGDMNISFPFGIGKDCYMDRNFAIDCDKGSTPPRAIISSIKMEVLKINTGTVYVKSPIFYSNCSAKDRNSSIPYPANLTGTPFSFSLRNVFMAVGCNTRAWLTTNIRSEVFGCDSTCRSGTIEVAEWDMFSSNNGCCYASIPADLLQSYAPNLGPVNVGGQDSGECRFAFLADAGGLVDLLNGSHPKVLQESKGYVSVALAWIPDANWKYDEKVMVCDFDIYDASATNFTFRNLECSCDTGYQGSPYLGCSDINECKDQTLHSCRGIRKCKNTVGSYRCETKLLWIIFLVAAAVIGVLLLLAFTRIAYNVMIDKKNIELKRKHFERNGGLLLQQQLSSTDGTVQRTKIFTSKELEAATDSFNENRVLGQGGQGTVYKGMLKDGGIVAVKKSTGLDESKVEVFINEVAILSQINHRNVVRLLGCCLETEVPLLVYEFISNGNLFDYLHSPHEDFPLTWEVRLRIATEVAGAVAYLHSEASIPVYHRDIKSSNILLDEKFRAKVSDFGISKWMDIDRTHLTTLVKGTFGYLDPEYFRSGQFTEKSDVYSFGVVLVELLSGKKPIMHANTQETAQGLAGRFICLMEEGAIYEFLDDMVKENSHEQQVIAVANLAKRCLHMGGKDRPTMREVIAELERIWQSNVKQENKEVDVFHSCRCFSSEVDPLITHTL